jgi:hypothetical protein
VGTGYFDQVAEVLSQRDASTLALEQSIETDEFRERKPIPDGDFLDHAAEALGVDGGLIG